MSFIVGDGGRIEVGPPEDDPIRKGHAQLVRLLAIELEMSIQAAEAWDNRFAEHRARQNALEKRVEFLEQMLTASTAVQR